MTTTLLERSTSLATGLSHNRTRPLFNPTDELIARANHAKRASVFAREWGPDRRVGRTKGWLYTIYTDGGMYDVEEDALTAGWIKL